ncbi:MAG: FHA domain-containing protein, partial [Armatimonadetes bacterium]|nr:FHA domain-containing protein [Armatimonadota bacterium]
MKLVVLNGDMANWEFTLEGEEMTLGRRSDNDIVLPADRRISRQHARVFERDGDWYIEDMGSANGTFVNDRRVHAPVRLRPGDRVRVGRTWLEVHPDPLSPEQRRAAQAVALVEEEGAGAVDDQSIVLQMKTGRAVSEEADAETLRRRLLILTHVAEALGSTLDLDELLGRVLDYILEVVPAQRGIILLRGDDGELNPRVVRFRGSEEVGQVSVSTRLVERALRDEVSILTEDALTDQRFRDASSIHDLRIRSAICTPLIHRGEPLGAIYLDTTSDSEIFGHDAVELLNSIAPQAAAALANATLYSQLRKAYDELQQTQEQLLRTEKLSSIGTLAASLGHDMGNILGPMGWLVERLARNGTLDEHGRELLVTQVQRLNTMLRRLLALARPQRTQKKPLDLNEVAEAVGGLLTTEARHRGIDLVLDLAEGLPRVEGDASQLEQAVLNLALNALEACSKGDKVTLRTFEDEGDVVLSVIDDGPGMPEEVQARLFQPFYTTKEKGTGLGLFSARRIVQEHGGVLEVDTRPGEGTTVSLRLLPVGKKTDDTGEVPESTGEVPVPEEALQQGASSPSAPEPKGEPGTTDEVKPPEPTAAPEDEEAEGASSSSAAAGAREEKSAEEES